jgi:serine/threonine protein kinase/tetratricopeptide (TPR) repeat protein
MDSGRLERLTELLDRGLDLPRTERQAFVDAECGEDEELRAELHSLLEASDSATEYFDELADQVVAPAYASLTKPPDTSELLPELKTALGAGYTIEKELGGGGMSRVFLAEEVRLRRKVVIKVLTPGLSSSVSGDRFRREIQLVAQLQHAHIVPLLSSDSTTSLVWFTMPFVAGESLRAKLQRDGALPLREAQKIWRDVLDALSYAHTSRVIHRDIKPGNILLSGRNALVTDFGVARAIEMSADTESTGAGFAVGTPAYMAPEQITGQAEVDHRVDIYASALVMYEMLEGRRPFRGSTTREIVLARLKQDPPEVSRADCPPQLRALVLRCLAKDPSYRPPTAEAVLAELDEIPANPTVQEIATAAPARSTVRRIAAIAVAAASIATGAFALVQTRSDLDEPVPSVPSVRPAIAVLPLKNLGVDPADSVLADGMTEEINRAIARGSNIRVIPSASIQELLSRRLDTRQIAESLEVSHVLEGGLQKSGSRIRFQVRLVDARDGSIHWSETFDREAGDVFAMQDDITRAVALGLDARLVPGATTGVNRRPPTSSIIAYEYYVRGLSSTRLRSVASRRQAIEFLTRATAEDSSFAAAYAALVWLLLNESGSEAGNYAEMEARARAAAERALALDSTLPQAHSALGWTYLGVQTERAIPLLKRAVALDPAAHRAYEGLARAYMRMGRPAEQLAAARLGLEVDPFSSAAMREMGLALLMNDRCDEAIDLLRPLKTLSPPRQVAGVVMGVCFAANGKWDEAIEEFRWADRFEARAALGLLGNALARSGRLDEARGILSDLLAGRRTSHGSWGIAVVYAGLGDNDRALEWLAKSEAEGSMRIYIMSPMFRDLQKDPRFHRSISERKR